MNGKVHTSFFNCNKTRVTEIYLRCKGKKKKKTEEKVIGVFKNKEHIFKKSQKKFFYTIRSFECTKKLMVLMTIFLNCLKHLRIKQNAFEWKIHPANKALNCLKMWI